MKRVLKPAMALVAVLGLLSFLATPSAASSGTITGGTLTVDLTPAITETLGTGTGSCTTSTNSITVLDDSTADTPSATRTGTVVFRLHTTFNYEGETFELIVTSSGSGGTNPTTGRYTSTHSTTSGHTLSVHFSSVQARIYRPPAGEPPCDSGTLICGPVTSNSLTLTGTGTFTAVHPAPLGNLHLAGNRVVSAFGCTAPFSAMNGRTVGIASLTATLT